MEILVAILTPIITLIVALIGFYSRGMNKKIKGVVTLVSTIGEQLTTVQRSVRLNADENRKEHIKLFSRIREQGAVVERIVTIKTLNEEIDTIVSKHLEYLYDNREAMNYLVHKAIAVKDFSERIIDSNFNVTIEEAKAKIDDCVMEVHSRDKLLGVDILSNLKSGRSKLEKGFSNEVSEIITDELVNSTSDRFRRAILYFLDQQSVLLVRTILKNKK